MSLEKSQDAENSVLNVKKPLRNCTLRICSLPWTDSDAVREPAGIARILNYVMRVREEAECCNARKLCFTGNYLLLNLETDRLAR